MRIKGMLLAVVLLFVASGGFSGGNSVDVSGNLAQDGYLTIDINWVVDTANYPKVQRSDLKRVVYNDIWAAAMPKLIQKSGAIASCEKSSFNKTAEHKKLVKKRPDGTEVYDYNAKVRFECAGNIKRMSDQDIGMQQQKFNEGFHDGFTEEANSF